ncbi:hypothetical protein BDA99DRAFT_516859 [Phascolomyces articulosus]|uniref:DDHD domain-containing protein n=1 Tax=Phascolomyces articulosus TaxID=60185 RepID=A0AAD5JVL8_9FUNG|nr:hypothetical protein BDA99DRAFT_516859 [Phascolomyces articulosus]
MFFETTYVPSPQLSATSTLEEEDDLTPVPLSPSLGTVPVDDTYCSDEALSESPVDHLVFVIHGIGQQTEQYGHFYEHINNLRETTRQVLQAKVPDHGVRIELIPIEWHRHIHEQTDPTMNRITLKSIPTIRLIENEYLADILFYFSKERGQSIVDNVTNLFNVSYHNFLEKHPDFNGKIVIIGYSLGGIITYDILSHQRQPETPEEEAEYRKIDVKYSKLDFKPSYFFGFGSPLAAMLTIRNQTPKLYHPDHDIVFENVFHPFDPLAYRFEPLINDYYTDHPAVLVKRSIPLGPSFSFPSLPSIPGAGIFSFFSWKASTSQQQQQQEQIPSSTNDAAEQITETMQTTSDAMAKIGDNEDTLQQQEQEQNYKTPESIVAHARNLPDDDQQQNKTQNQENNMFRSPINAFFQYFSSPSSSTQRKLKKGKQEETTAATTTTSDEEEEQQVYKNTEAIPTTIVTHHDGKSGIIDFDSLQNDANNKDQHGLTLRSNHSDSTLHTAEHEQKQQEKINRPVMRSRSRTFGSTHEFLKVNNEKNTLLYHTGTTTAPTTMTQKQTVENKHDVDKIKKQQRHLVEVLGIDGVRMESFERAQINFSLDHYNKQKNKEAINQEQEPQINKENNPKKEEEPTKMTTSTMSSTASTTNNKSPITTETKKEHQGSSSNDLWSDLNQEITEPGPAVTEPGQSKEQVIMDATQAKSNHDGDEDKNSNNNNNHVGTDVGNEKAKEAEDVKQQAKLPGGRRIDHVLQPESFMSMIANEYLVGLRAHFSYWTNKDLLWHIVCRLENLDETTAMTTTTKGGDSSAPSSSSTPSSSSSISLSNHHHHNDTTASSTNNNNKDTSSQERFHSSSQTTTTSLIDETYRQHTMFFI